MRILTFNIWNYSGNWRIRRHELVAAIAGAAADVVALQEVRHNWKDAIGRNQARWLGEQLGYRWFYRPANVYLPFPLVTEGLGFLLRERPEKLSLVRVPKQGRGPRRIVLRMRLRGLDIYNVHYPLSPGARITESSLLIDLLDQDRARPSVALGDFNADADQEPMRMLFGAGLRDLWTELPASEPDAKRWPDSRRIDYVLGRNVDTTGGTVESIGTRPGQHGLCPSDHFGILVSLPKL